MASLAESKVSILENIEMTCSRNEILACEPLLWQIVEACLHPHQDVASAALKIIRKGDISSLYFIFVRVLQNDYITQRVLYNVIRLARDLRLKSLIPLIIERIERENLSDTIFALVFSTCQRLSLYSPRLTKRSLVVLSEASRSVNLEKPLWISAFIYLKTVKNQSDLAIEPEIKRDIDQFFQSKFPRIRVDELVSLDQFMGYWQAPQFTRVNDEDPENLAQVSRLSDPGVWQYGQAQSLCLRNIHDFSVLNDRPQRVQAVKESIAGLLRADIKSQVWGLNLAMVCQFPEFVADITAIIEQGKDLFRQSIADRLMLSHWKALTPSVEWLIKKESDAKILIACFSYLHHVKPDLTLSFDLIKSQATRIIEQQIAEINVIIADVLTHYFPHHAYSLWRKCIQYHELRDEVLCELLNYASRIIDQAVVPLLSSYIESPHVQDSAIRALLNHQSDQSCALLLTRVSSLPQDESMSILILDRLDPQFLPLGTAVFDLVDIKSCSRELRESLFDLHNKMEIRRLAQSHQNLPPEVSNLQKMDPQVLKDIQVDLALKLKYYDQLSDPIKKSVRTAELFHAHFVHIDHAIIDLSPIINMLNKSLELLFKDLFESRLAAIVRDKEVKKKLDLLGYTRGVKAKLGKLEAYLATLPYIEEIPYFSANKLKKMLTAVCAYNENRKFMFDGIKAFALFFLTFARGQCPFGLSNILSFSPMSEDDLLKFCRDVHLMQDMRNRLIHESVSVSYFSDVQQYRLKTYAIMNKMFAMTQVI